MIGAMEKTTWTVEWSRVQNPLGPPDRPSLKEYSVRRVDISILIHIAAGNILYLGSLMIAVVARRLTTLFSAALVRNLMSKLSCVSQALLFFSTLSASKSLSFSHLSF